jgi:hypothetical protein
MSLISDVLSAVYDEGGYEKTAGQVPALLQPPQGPGASLRLPTQASPVVPIPSPRAGPQPVRSDVLKGPAGINKTAGKKRDREHDRLRALGYNIQKIEASGWSKFNGQGDKWIITPPQQGSNVRYDGGHGKHAGFEGVPQYINKLAAQMPAQNMTHGPGVWGKDFNVGIPLPNKSIVHPRNLSGQSMVASSGPGGSTRHGLSPAAQTQSVAPAGISGQSRINSSGPGGAGAGPKGFFDTFNPAKSGAPGNMSGGGPAGVSGQSRISSGGTSAWNTPTRNANMPPMNITVPKPRIGGGSPSGSGYQGIGSPAGFGGVPKLPANLGDIGQSGRPKIDASGASSSPMSRPTVARAAPQPGAASPAAGAMGSREAPYRNRLTLRPLDQVVAGR